jgi:hypothetical protein
MILLAFSTFNFSMVMQDRQARIENLLLMLTRGMRHETAP